MFDVPLQENIAKVIITGHTVRNGAEPEIMQRARTAKRSRSKSAWPPGPGTATCWFSFGRVECQALE